VWRKLHNQELNDLNSSPNIVRVITSRKIRWAGHVARMERGRGVYRVLVVNMREREHWENPGVDGMIILR
jgi:GMP synthase-like glutamine amidotransferase